METLQIAAWIVMLFFPDRAKRIHNKEGVSTWKANFTEIRNKEDLVQNAAIPA